MKTKLMVCSKNMMKIKTIYYNSKIFLNSTNQRRYLEPPQFGLILEVSEFKETLNSHMRIMMRLTLIGYQEK